MSLETRVLLCVVLVTAEICLAVGFTIGRATAAAAPAPARVGTSPADIGPRRDVPHVLSRPAPPRPHVSRDKQRAPLPRRAELPGWPWQQLALCESNGHWDYGAPGAYTDGDGYEGGLNYAPSTWLAYRLPGYPAHAYTATPTQQITVARRVLTAQGWAAWPACSRRLGLR